MFERIAIVNRGEAAMRLIRAAREIQFEQDAPLTTIAFYTEVERNAMFVREADEAILIHSSRTSAYLDHQVLEAALRRCGADAVWVGWGFVSEDPEFADLVERMGLTRPVTTQDLAWAAAYLASSKSSTVTGQTLAVDGGHFMNL